MNLRTQVKRPASARDGAHRRSEEPTETADGDGDARFVPLIGEFPWSVRTRGSASSWASASGSLEIADGH
jgi:hypothetical protein